MLYAAEQLPRKQGFSALDPDARQLLYGSNKNVWNGEVMYWFWECFLKISFTRNISYPKFRIYFQFQFESAQDQDATPKLKENKQVK